MGLFGLGKKKNLDNRDQLREVLRNLKFETERPMGIVVDEQSYSIISKANFVAISEDGEKWEEFLKYEIMDSESICAHTEYYINQGDIESAEACIEQGLRVDDQVEDGKNNWKVYYLAGNICLMKRMLEQTFNFLNYSLELGCPKHVECYNAIAAVYALSGNPDKALEYYLKALDENKEDVETLHNIGGFYWDNNDLGQAARSYCSAIKLCRNHFATYEEIGNLLKQCGNEKLSNLFLNGFKESKSVTDDQIKVTEEWIENNI